MHNDFVTLMNQLALEQNIIECIMRSGSPRSALLFELLLRNSLLNCCQLQQRPHIAVIAVWNRIFHTKTLQLCPNDIIVEEDSLAPEVSFGHAAAGLVNKPVMKRVEHPFFSGART